MAVPTPKHKLGFKLQEDDSCVNNGPINCDSRLLAGWNIGAGGFFLQVVDGIRKNCSGSEKLMTCFLTNF
jgi:hypothetical protein